MQYCSILAYVIQCGLSSCGLYASIIENYAITSFAIFNIVHTGSMAVGLLKTSIIWSVALMAEVLNNRATLVTFLESHIMVDSAWGTCTLLLY